MKDKSKPRKKVIPHCYQRTKSASLSDVIKLGAYKRKIINLARNNRRLAVELEEARCENAFQSKILRDCYTRDSSKIMRAQMKIRDMVKTINTLVCDIDEVKSYLDIDWSAMKETVFQNRHTSDSKIIKAPVLDGITEVSISVPEPEVSAESVKSPLTADGLVSSDKSCDHDEILPSISELRSCETDCIQESNKVISPPVENEMPPLIFAEESIDENRKDSRNTKPSKEKSDGSLTPELDIDFSCYRRKKSSSRRQTLFSISSNSRIHNSGGKVSSCDKTDLLEMKGGESPADNCVTEENKISQVLHRKKQEQSENLKTLTDSSKASCFSTNVSDANDQLPSLAVLSLENASSILQKLEVAPQLIEENHTLLLNEDMELTEVFNPSCNPILVGNNTATAAISAKNKENEIHKDKNEKVKEILKSNKEKCNIDTYEQGNFVSKENSLQEDITVNKNRKRSRKSFQEDLSPVQKVASRSKASINYAVFFSDSENNSTPPKTVKKRKCTDRETVVFVNEVASKKSVSKTIEDYFSQQNHSLQNENNSKLDDTSIFNFNASFSEKSNKHTQQKKSKLSRNKKSTKEKNEPAKPLSQSCNVTKLNGFNLKFSKSNNDYKKNKYESIFITKRPEKKSDKNSCTSLSNIMGEEILFSENDQNKEKTSSSDESIIKHDVTFENKSSFTDLGSFLSPRTILKNKRISEQGKKSEAKRVSFHVSDLVCNFSKTSVSKTIADNTKVWRTSKSVVDFQSTLPPFEKDEKCNVPQNDMSDDITMGRSENTEGSLLELSDETEIYNLSYPETAGTVSVFSNINDFTVSHKPPNEPPSNEVQNNRFIENDEHSSDKLNSRKVKTIPHDKKDIMPQKNIVNKVSGMDKKTLQVSTSALKIKDKISLKKSHNASKGNFQNELKSDKVSRSTEHYSNKSNVLIKNSNKINIIPHHGKDILSPKIVIQKESNEDKKTIHLKSIVPSAPKVKCKSPQKVFCSSSKENALNNPNRMSKHRNSKILEMLSFNDSILSEVNVDKNCPNNNDCKASVDKDISPKKDKTSRSAKQKKNNSKKSIQSTPVLKDRINLDDLVTLNSETPFKKSLTEEPVENAQSSRARRSKTVSYKEPSLNKKLRRE